MANKSYFISGIADMLVLFILKEKDSYVYEITTSLDELSGGLLNISQNTVYTAAYKLSKAGHISEYTVATGKNRVRVYYHLEPSGVEFLDKLMKSYQDTLAGIRNVMDRVSEQQPADRPPAE